jgi:hypothetical protein
MSTHSTITEAVGPTGNIKIFIDAFNKDFDIKIKSLLDSQQNYKNVYADAIKITTPKEGPWPNDPKVVTIGDLFKHTFPDIESDLIIVPQYSTQVPYVGLDDHKGWLNDLQNSKDEKIKTMYSTIKSGIRSNKTLERYQNVKKPGITNPSLYSPGQYYFDVFMSSMLSQSGPLKSPSEGNGGEDVFGGNIIEGGGWLNGWLKKQGGSVSVSNFDPNDSITKENHDNGSSIVFGYSAFSQILHSGFVNVKISDQVKETTGIDLDLDLQNSQDRPPESWVNLKTQYKTGLLSDFIENGTRPIGTASGEKFIKKDPTFFMNFLYDAGEGGRGQLYDSADKFADPEDIFGSNDVTGYKFKGFYEDIILYKAFVQAGDNYKSVVLPRNLVLNTVKAEDLKVDFVNTKVETPTAIGEVQFKFNVEKTDTFVVVGGTVTPPLEFVIVANDGVNYILDTPDVFDDLELDEEYTEVDAFAEEEAAIILNNTRLSEQEYIENNNETPENKNETPEKNGVDLENKFVSGSGIQPLKDLIFSGESSNYDAMYRSTTYKAKFGVTCMTQTIKTVVAKASTGVNGKDTAIGRYQNLAQYVLKRARTAGLDPNTALYNEKNQELMGESLIQDTAGAYLSNKQTGTQKELEKAIQKLGNMWASLPTIHDAYNSSDIRGSVVTGKSVSAGNGKFKGSYAGQGGRHQVGEVVQMLIQTRISLGFTKPVYIPTYYKSS